MFLVWMIVVAQRVRSRPTRHAQVRGQRKQVERAGENVLPFRDPSDGLHVHRMRREQCGQRPDPGTPAAAGSARGQCWMQRAARHSLHDNPPGCAHNRHSIQNVVNTSG